MAPSSQRSLSQTRNSEQKSGRESCHHSGRGGPDDSALQLQPGSSGLAHRPATRVDDPFTGRPPQPNRRARSVAAKYRGRFHCGHGHLPCNRSDNIRSVRHDGRDHGNRVLPGDFALAWYGFRCNKGSRCGGRTAKTVTSWLAKPAALAAAGLGADTTANSSRR